MPTSVVHHLRRIVKLTEDGKGTIAFVTNDMTHSSEEICEIYRRRWAIETLYKLLKQNFPLKYFLGDNVNAIEIQIWVTMIAYLLTKVVAKKSQSKLAFSSIVTTIRITLTEYIDIISLLNDPDKSMLRWELAEAERAAGEQNSLQLELFDTP
jgi:glycerol-3-phosphate O-acyltransferase